MTRILFSALFFVVLAVAPLHAQSVEKLVTVTGQGSVTAVPDTALIRVGVTSQGKTARAASEANAKHMTAVTNAIKLSGIADRDIQTSRLSLQPQYDTSKGGTAHLLGFRVSNQITMTIHDISDLPNILDRAIAAGANEMSGIEFRVSNQSKLLDKARIDAIADARRKAELYASAAGVKLGRVVAITEEGAAVPPPHPLQAMRASGVPIAAGERELRVSVTVSYALGQ